MQLPDLSLLLVMAIFWATYFILRKFVFSPLGRILAEREGDAEKSAAAAAAALEREKAAQQEFESRLTEARREAMAKRDARRQAVTARRQAMADQAREAARKRMLELDAALSAEIEAAKQDLAAGAPALAGEIASTVTGRRAA